MSGWVNEGTNKIHTGLTEKLVGFLAKQQRTEMFAIGRMAISLTVTFISKANRFSQIVAGVGSNTHHQGDQLYNDVVADFFTPDKLSINLPMKGGFCIVKLINLKNISVVKPMKMFHHKI